MFTEFFYVNEDRQVIEFLKDKDMFIMEAFFKNFLPAELREFSTIRIYNDSEEEIRQWFYESENVVIAIRISWGFKKQEMYVEIDAENFYVNALSEEGELVKNIDPSLLNDYLISFLTGQAKTISTLYKALLLKNSVKQVF